ncbi:MAG: flagellin [Huintestinicola sp.]
MVVQHNISAMNANRYYGINNSGLSKSLEKLSSGYAINRAGDNAAGLAVSEKMRSQINGLTQGVKNAQDGISMIQTYEGALTETDSILQRMKTLATQSANGTYQDDVDRDAIQLEFDQLNDELNQIADTDFNGVVALNGGVMADGSVANNNKMVSDKASIVYSANADASASISYSESVRGSVDSSGNGTIKVNGVNLTLKEGETEANVAVGDSSYSATGITVDGGKIADGGEITAKTVYKIDENTKNITINGTNYTISGDKLLDKDGNEVTAGTGKGQLNYTIDEGNSVTVTSVYTVEEGGAVKNQNDEVVGQIDLKEGVSVSNAYEHGANNLTYADSITLQVGARSKDAVDFTFAYTTNGIGDLKSDMDCSARGLGTDQLSLRTQEEANFAIDKIDNAINKVSMVRATFGAVQNRLEHKIDNMNVTKENITSAESRIRDTDMAQEMTNFTKNQILSQASQAMLAQANTLPQGVLQLLG